VHGKRLPALGTLCLAESARRKRTLSATRRLCASGKKPCRWNPIIYPAIDIDNVSVRHSSKLYGSNFLDGLVQRAASGRSAHRNFRGHEFEPVVDDSKVSFTYGPCSLDQHPNEFKRRRTL
jgi:hypothetical protein